MKGLLICFWKAYSREKSMQVRRDKRSVCRPWIYLTFVGRASRRRMDSFFLVVGGGDEKAQPMLAGLLRKLLKNRGEHSQRFDNTV